MTTNESRASTLAGALRAGLTGNRRTVEEACTDDVRMWSPAITAGSRAELLEVLDRRDGAFSDLELDVTPLDVGGDFACVEWTVRMTHSGPLELANGARFEPSGEAVIVNGATIAEFDGDRICSLRQYWDEFAVLEQLGVLSADDVSS
jgi:ketosteroid isomerase-like protein